MRKKYTILGIIFFVTFAAFSSCWGRNIQLNDEFFQVLGLIESNNKDSAIGDNGKAIGRYQIHYNYYLDAKEYDKSIKFSYKSLTNEYNCRKVVIAYMNRYVKDWTLENVVRTHNGGCGWKKNPKNTDNYWKKFKRNYINQ